jgi:undecaprenyl-diphosphatase
MPEWIGVVLLGVIEGITEFLPISSTGHLLLVEHFIHLKRTDLFNVVIQTGAVLAVVPLFRARVRTFLRWQEAAGRDYLLKTTVAFGITGVGGLLLEKNRFQLPEAALPVALALLIGGILFLGVEGWLQGRAFSEEVTWPVVGLVGMGQIIAAVCPGASRSGTTILLSLMLGLSRPAATEFSFLVSIPTMAAAGGLKILKQLNHSAGTVPEDWAMLILATIVAATVSFIVVKWFLRFVQSHTFVGFGWYRIALGMVLLIFCL